MSNIVAALRSFPDFIGGKGCNENAIASAEQALGLSFAVDYQEYLSAFGLASFDGHELTGICKSPRLDVVKVTLDEQKHSPDASGWYVVEQANIDDIVIWQSPVGAIYQTVYGLSPRKLCDSLVAYVKGQY